MHGLPFDTIPNSDRLAWSTSYISSAVLRLTRLSAGALQTETADSVASERRTAVHLVVLPPERTKSRLAVSVPARHLYTEIWHVVYPRPKAVHERSRQGSCYISARKQPNTSTHFQSTRQWRLVVPARYLVSTEFQSAITMAAPGWSYIEKTTERRAGQRYNFQPFASKLCPCAVLYGKINLP